METVIAIWDPEKIVLVACRLLILVKLGYDNVNLRVDMGVRDEASRNSIISKYVH